MRGVLFLVCGALNLAILSFVFVAHYSGDDVLCPSGDKRCSFKPEPSVEFKTTQDAKYSPSLRSLLPDAGWSLQPSVEAKYFQEPEGIVHADARYYSELFNDKKARKNRVVEMFAAWSSFADANALPYWIIHGTLIGYYFNGHVLPWDDDIDLQMVYGDLVELTRFNNTLIGGQFLIDVNPNFIYRSHMEDNVIDARIVDTLTGAFIDITGIAAVRKALWGARQYSCKSPHYYYYSDLFPLQRAIFEGVNTWVPSNINKILVDEYGSKVLTKHQFSEYTWNGTLWAAPS